MTPKPTLKAAMVVVLVMTVKLSSAYTIGPYLAQQCQSMTYNASGRYLFCQQRAWSKIFLECGPSCNGFGRGRDKLPNEACVYKYASKWEKLQSRCVGDRFVLDDETVTDRLTQLQWERKTDADSIADLANPHDADNKYTWSAGGDIPAGARRQC